MTLIMPNASKTDELVPSPFTYDVIACYMGVIVGFGILLNLFVFAVLVSDRTDKSPSTAIMISLSCNNLLGPLISYPLSLVANLKRGWPFGSPVCIWYGFVGSLVGFGAIYHLTLLSIERYISLVHPLTRDRIISKASLTAALSLAWILSFGISLLPVVGWGAYVNEGIGTACSVRWYSDEGKDLSYNLFIFIVGYFIPVIIIVLCHARFLKEISKLANRIQSDASRKMERQMAIVVMVMIIAFNVAWFPYACASLVGMFASKDALSPLAASLPAFFAKSATLYDPIIYALLNREFRAKINRRTRRVADGLDTSIN